MRTEAQFRVIVCAVLLSTAVVVFRSPYRASDLEPVPDAVEYAVGAQRLATVGTYDLLIEGRSLPPRYPPAFSILLSPIYRIWPAEIGAGVLVVCGFALLAAGAACWIGAGESSLWSALLAGISVMVAPGFASLSSLVMSDVPTCALILVAAALYRRVSSTDTPRSSTLVGAGLACAFAGAMRPLSYLFLVPFGVLLWRRRRENGIGQRWLALCAAPLLTLAAGLAYNAQVFGSPLRSGYDFWCPEAYGELSSLLSMSHFGINWERTIFESAFPVVLATTGSLLLIQRLTVPPDSPAWKRSRTLIEFSLPGSVGIVLFHLFYFFPDPRFLLPVQALWVVLGASILGSWIPRTPFRGTLAVVLLLLVASYGLHRVHHYPRPERRITLERLARETPGDAWIITGCDPVYAEPILLRRTKRRVIPISRRVEYASRYLARDSKPEPAVRLVASEGIETLAAEARGGRPLYLDEALLTSDDHGTLEALRRTFRFEPVGKMLFKLDVIPSLR